MQSVSSRIWTRIAESTSCDDNHYTTGTSVLCYATMCPVGLQGAVHSQQVYQLILGTDIGFGLLNAI